MKTTLLCLALLFPVLYAESIEKRFTFRHLTIDDGLSQSSVLDIAGDSQGYLWFATQDGLDRYDGYSFRHFRYSAHDSTSISDNYISRITPSRKGGLWIGTYAGGLNYYDPEQESFVSLQHDTNNPNSLIGDHVSAILENVDSSLWIACWSAGLNRFDPQNGTWSSFQSEADNPLSLPTNRISSLYQDKRFLWVGTWNGVARLALSDWQKGQFERIYFSGDGQQMQQKNQIKDIIRLNESQLLAATWGGGLNIIDTKMPNMKDWQSVYQPSGAQIGLQINKLLKDNSGRIWIATYDAGLFIWDPVRNHVNVYRHDPYDRQSIGSNALNSLYQDKSQRIWIGSAYGISHLNPLKTNFFNYRSVAGKSWSLSHPFVQAVLQDKKGVLWVGTMGGGLNYLPQQQQYFKQYRFIPGKRNSIASDRITSLLEDRNGNIWIGHLNKGLDRFDPVQKRFFHYKARPAGLSSNSIVTLYEDHLGLIWIGTSGGGLCVFNPRNKKFKTYTNKAGMEHSISGSWVWSLAEDDLGRIWAGTWGAGVNRFDRTTETFTRYVHNKHDTLSLSNNTVFCITEGPDKRLWMGTWGRGINIYNPRTDQFTSFTEEDGLANNVVYGILFDAMGNMWCSTNHGLSRYDLKKGTFTNFDVDAGLQSNEFNQSAYFKDRDQRLYFGGINGLTVFDPLQIQINTHVPPIAITKFSIHEKNYPVLNFLNQSKPLKLNYRQDSFSFEMAALDFSAPSKNQYAYFLKGFDSDWIYSGTRRFASYTNLPPASYKLYIKGANNFGIWNPEPLMLSLEILPPFWMRWWFITLSLFIVFGTIASFLIYRIRNLIAIERLRTKIAADLHDDVGAGLTEISILNEIVAQRLPAPAKQATHQEIKQIGEKSRNLIDKMSDIVWLINPKKDTLFDLLSRLSDTVQHLLINSDIIYQAKNMPFLKNINLPMEQRQHLFLLLREALNNAIKHSDASEISLNVEIMKKELIIRVTDNGTGFRPGSHSSGNGLNNMKRRARKLKGILRIYSPRGQSGTIVEFRGKFK